MRRRRCCSRSQRRLGRHDGSKSSARSVGPSTSFVFPVCDSWYTHVKIREYLDICLSTKLPPSLRSVSPDSLRAIDTRLQLDAPAAGRPASGWPDLFPYVMLLPYPLIDILAPRIYRLASITRVWRSPRRVRIRILIEFPSKTRSRYFPHHVGEMEKGRGAFFRSICGSETMFQALANLAREDFLPLFP